MDLKRDKNIWHEAIDAGCTTVAELALFLKHRETYKKEILPKE